MGTVEPGPELAANALGQLGCAEALNGILSDFPFPVTGDGRWADPRNPLDDLGKREIELRH